MAKKNSPKKDGAKKRNRAKSGVSNSNPNNPKNTGEDNANPQNAKASEPRDNVKSSDKSAPVEKQKSAGFNIVKFLQESKEELSKVVWPSRQQLIGESASVILMVALVATTIYFVDNLFVWLSGRIF